MKVLFYIENNWVFGKIHNELIKALYPEIYCDILDWRVSYTHQDFSNFSKKYDFIVSTISSTYHLHKNYGVNENRLIGMAHGDSDIIDCLKVDQRDFFNNIRGYFVISNKLVEFSLKHLQRVPNLLNIGVFTKNYPKNKNSKIKNIGYLSVPITHNYLGIDIKRGHIVKKVSEIMGLPLIHNTQMNFLGIEKAYEDISLIMFSSLTEGNPYAAIEGFACGIPIIGTDCGIFSEKVKFGGGYIAPFIEYEYIDYACQKINEINNGNYERLKNESFLIGQSLDWSVLKNKWVEFFNSL